MKKKFIPKQTKDHLTVEYDKDDFLDSLPNLATELLDTDNPGRLPIDELKNTVEEIPDPTIYDFLQRCNTNEEAFEILEFFTKNSKINSQEANAIKTKIEKDGIRCLGAQKKWGYYERTYRRGVTQ